MKFLEEIAKAIVDRYAEVSDEVTVVFPNRRAGLFFQKYLSANIVRPVWSPKIINIEDFIVGLSTLKPADTLDLIFELYQVFKKLNESNEVFDRFYYWGNIMLQDFDELDKFLIDPELLFKNLAHIKNLENGLDYLDEDQKILIKDFWSSFNEKFSSHQKGFLGIWDNMFQTYHKFKIRLYEKGMAYNGMIYRDVEHELEIGQSNPNVDKVIFAGFNALSKSEESIITWFLKEGKGEIYWDADDYYLSNSRQEAGKYMREMKFGNPVLRNSFKESYGNGFIESDKKIEVISVASDVGQAQQAAKILESIDGRLDENIALVLPNTELLFPLLHALPEKVDKLNITMGFPLTATSVYGFLEAVIDLQAKAEGKKVYHFRPALTVLRHPVFSKIRDEEISEIEKSIIKNNTIWIPSSRFNINNQVLNVIFRDPGTQFSDYLIEIVRFIAEANQDDVEREIYFQFYTSLSRLNEFILSNNLAISRLTFQKLFRQIIQNERIPFEGEPLLGLQVMGILETRNLDFDTIIVLSMNEGLIPPVPKNTSLIPYSIRKAFELPVVDHQDAMYAYIFYQMVQRAKNIYFIYNSTEGTGKSGEVSRFVRQLEHETDLTIEKKTVSSQVALEDPRIISIAKDTKIFDRLYQFTSEMKFKKRFTPTAINTYLDCGLKFYFKYVLELYEEEEMFEEVDPMVFGNILHHVMEQLYLPFDVDGNRIVNREDVKNLRKGVDTAIDKEFAEQFGSEELQFRFEGQNVLARGIIKKMVLKVLEFDTRRAPFEILGVEAGDKKGYALDIAIEIGAELIDVGMKGIIDRIEQKDETIRIVDYKTGKDEKNFTDILSLFNSANKNRNKAVFQTFFYGLLCLNARKDKTDYPVQASLFNIRDLFNTDFSPLIQCKKVDVPDIRVYLKEYEEQLKLVLNEIFDRSITFSQTNDQKKCLYCPYSGICNR